MIFALFFSFDKFTLVIVLQWKTHVKLLIKDKKLGALIKKKSMKTFVSKTHKEKEKLFNALETWLSTNLDHTNVWGPLPSL